MEKLLINEIKEIIAMLKVISDALPSHTGGLEWCDIHLKRLLLIKGKIAGIENVFRRTIKERARL